MNLRRAIKSKNLGSLLQFLLISIVLLLLGNEVSNNWAQIVSALSILPIVGLLLSLVLLIVGILSGVTAWHLVINHLGATIPKKGTFPIYLVGQLGKYIPGSVWAVFIQMELGRKWLLSRSTTFVASLILLGFTILTGGLFGLFTARDLLESQETVWHFVIFIVVMGIPFLHYRFLALGSNFILRILKKPKLTHPLSQEGVFQISLWLFFSWLLVGGHIWVLANSFSDPGLIGFMKLASVMALAMIAGQIAFFLPSGVGVREMILVSGLQLFVDYDQALAIALVSRLMFTLSDLVLGAFAMIYSRDKSLSFKRL